MNTDQLNHNYRPSTSFDDREDYQSSKVQQLEDNYSDALVKYKQAMTELEKALGVQKDFEKTSWSAEESVEDLRLNKMQYALINRFESAVKKVIETKGRL